jgi:DNA mismatch repair protein MutS2
MKTLYDNLPKLDLHGEDRVTAAILTNDFIRDNYKIKNKRVIIIHGVGEGIILKTVHNILKKHDLVLKYEIDIFNGGATIIELKTDRL